MDRTEATANIIIALINNTRITSSTEAAEDYKTIYKAIRDCENEPITLHI